MLKYNTDVPVLLLVYNRPEFTKKVLEVVLLANPKRIYVAGDGPKNEIDAVKCKEVRDLFTDLDYKGTLITKFGDVNLGCGICVSQNIKWFFEHEEEGIVLEDDCFPSISFFAYCSTLLEYYRHDNRIGHIGGANFQNGIKRGSSDYYFSNLTHVWGWADWRRVWDNYDFNLKTLPQFESLIDELPSHKPYASYWLNALNKTATREIDTWDYQYAYLNILMGYKSIIPNVNLIKNIGVGINSTHTINHPFADQPLFEINSISHPIFMISNISADLYTQEIEYSTNGIEKKKNILSRFWKSVKENYLKQLS